MTGNVKYQQLQELLKLELKDGNFKPGDRFYTDKEIKLKYNLSSGTVTRALADMASKGYFKRHRKRGTFVLESPEDVDRNNEMMTKPLYLNGWESDEFQEIKGPSWFVVEEIRRGIINTYPGAVRILPIEEIGQMLKEGEDINTVFYHPTKEFVESHTPHFKSAVILNTTRQYRLKYNSVMIEWIPGVYDAVTYLIRELGHTRIAYIGREEPLLFERYGGYRIALESYGVPLCSELVRRKPDYLSDESGEEAMNELLKLDEPPTAVFADSDWKAVGAVNAIRKAGLRVPEDISVVGFDDMPKLKSMGLALTTVRIPYFELGKTAVEILLEKLRTGKDIPTKIIKSELLIRGSTAPKKE